MPTLNVDLLSHSYPIYIGADLSCADFFVPHIKSKQVAVITNTTVAPLYLDKLKQALAGYQLISVILPDGEIYKNLETINLVFDELLQNRLERNVTLIALGGGVIGDMTGFASACYLRGVNFIQVPTTLLAQVDSSVGGKTGVNHRLGKNMIGAFYQPQAVVIDVSTLQTLAKREVASGLAEIIKYALIADCNFLTWIENNIDGLNNLDERSLSYAIEYSCKLKAQIVGEDEHENGIRAILNLGHTFGHAIEVHQGYGVWLHGEAVAVGMVMALQMGVLLGKVTCKQRDRVILLLQKANLPWIPPNNMTALDFKQIMAQDKKVTDGAIRLILLDGLGKAYVSADYSLDILEQTLITDFSSLGK